ncbi:serine hydrolase [Roseivirga sp. UBA838]|uniref:serine hydrolase domain-containing protein n=1 Tax=Roseivirga sp. UBA838 TaxID=1947393 RepID=UPI00257D35E5|nr:serine hydrolase [Roseivirga sp. UBA838]|tara:strand:+ start:36785 stop:38131 length:1347 start_codon:yes stop_codon:yes gene_type:complete
MKKVSLVMMILACSASVGLAQKSLNRSMGGLSYGSPEQVGINGEVLSREIERIITQAIDSMAFPGAQVLLAKGGVIFYQGTFGYHTYDSLQPVQPTDLYDLASVTKVTAATLALMKLYDDGLFDLDKTFSHYFPKIARGDKKDLTMREILAHQAGLKAWIPYWSESQRKNGKWRWNTVKTDSSRRFPHRLEGTDLWLHKNFKERKIYKAIRKSEVSEEKKYLYSGLVFYLFPDLVERLTGEPFDEYLRKHFYEPLGAETLGFNPLNRFPSERIVPTEKDTFFRKTQLHGVVHDEGAAMMLGVSGNAGLFSNAHDLAKVYQMLLNGGEYEGKTYLSTATIEEFTRVQFPENGNRRGLGFDKPLLEYNERISSVARGAMPSSYGHTGYTGTLVWADPDYDLLFIFLSNRVFPTRNNSKIYNLNVRPSIHNLVYELLRIADGTYTIGTHWN